MRSMMVALVALLTLTVAGIGFSSAEAAPETRNGFCGAANMLASDAMAGYFADPPFGPMVRNTTQNTNGNDGMFLAVALSDCS